MATRVRHSRRGLGYERAGVIDFPWDVDPASGQGPRSDVTCEIPWRAPGFAAIEVYLDPALGDRADELCDTVRGLASTQRDVDALGEALMTLGRQLALGVAVHERPGDEPSSGVIAVAITLG